MSRKLFSKVFIVIISIVVAAYIFYRASITQINQNINTTNVTEDEIVICSQDSDCIIVPYQHCCGSSKKAINKKYRSLYFSKPGWQKFDKPVVCAKIGICAPDEKLNTATCSTDKQCTLVR